MLFYAEMTDTFSGEANYSWVKRFKIRAASMRGAVWKLSRETGYSFRFDGSRYNAKHACVCAFIEEFEDQNYGAIL